MLRVKGQLGSSSCSYLQIILHTEEAVVLRCMLQEQICDKSSAPVLYLKSPGRYTFLIACFTS